MKSTLTDVLLLLLYFVIVFALSRLLDLVTWYHLSTFSTQAVDPFLLSVRQIKYFLELRGVSYAGYVEKKELVQLLEESAPVLQGEVDEVTQVQDSSDGDNAVKDHASQSQSSSYFLGGSHFYEQVEDTKDSVWLLQVVPSNNKDEPLLDDYSWRSICNQLAPFAIRTGILDCKLDRRLCMDKGWHKPLLLLALPKGSKSKDKVIIKTFQYKNSSKNIPRPQVMQWVREQLSVRVDNVESIEDVETNWLQETVTNASSLFYSALTNKQVKVLLLTHLLQPPLFLAALSIRFTGRIKFGFFSVKKEDSESVRKKLKLPDGKLPNYVVITPEKKVFYGRKRREHFNFKSMNFFLKAIQPEMNDVFLCTMILVNMFIILQSLRTVWFSPRWKDIGLCFWMLVTHNFWLFVIWLLVFTVCTFSFTNFLINMSLICIRCVALSDLGCLLRNDFQLVYNYSHLFFFSFFVYCSIILLIERKFYHVGTVRSTEPNRAWAEFLSFESYTNDFFRELEPLTRPLRPNDEAFIEESLEMLIERLSVPNFWLRPVVRNDYLKDLPVWKFENWKSYKPQLEKKCSLNENSPNMIEHMMDSDNSVCYRQCENVCRCSVSQNTKDSMKYNVFGSGNVKTEEKNLCGRCLKCMEMKRDKDNMNSKQGATLNCDTGVSSSSNLPQSHEKHLCDSKDCTKKNLYCGELLDDTRNTSSFSEESEDESLKPPKGMLPVYECAICLETYQRNAILCGLPCRHNFHQDCIMHWLSRDNHQCPVCRWPAYKSNPNYTLTRHPHFD